MNYATGAYEEWVRRLRAWGEDPSVPLEGLPQLTAESFTPSTFNRLLGHIGKALAGQAGHWQRALERELEEARDDNELAMALVHARKLLVPRLQLASHPALPDELRRALMRETRDFVTDVQGQLERAVRESSPGTTLATAFTDQRLALLRDNSLVAVLDAPVPPLGTPADAPPAHFAEEAPPHDRREPRKFGWFAGRRRNR